MDRIKLEQLITENMKSIFGFALTRLGNVTEAEELASDILYAIIKSAKNLKNEERFYGFMWKIAENTYMDHLRKKSKHMSSFAELDENMTDESDSVWNEILKTEDLRLLRRELSLLSKQYRDATVLYYIENFSCSEVANRLHISTEMVKYYLFRARKIIREGMNMERLYGQKSYRPEGFEIDYWGLVNFNPNDYEDFKKRKIKGNILLSAYYNAMSMQELSIELGVALPYLEDEIRLLIEQKYLVCDNGKYLTNIPIFTLDCTNVIHNKLKELTEDAARKFIAVKDEFDLRFGHRFANENISHWQKTLMCFHFSLMETENDLKKSYGISKSGVVWGRNFDVSVQDGSSNGIQGIYNGCSSNDGRGSVIAMNFKQTLNAQHFNYSMTEPLVCVGTDRYESLQKTCQEHLGALGYVANGKANFAVWTVEEYEALREMLGDYIAIVSELNRKTSSIAADVTADLAPAHIRKTAGYVGAVVYRFHSIENLVNTLFDMEWLKAVHDKEKPAICVVKN